jgi:hypothetical protein
VTGVGQAIRYRVGVGTVGKHGSYIDRKYIRPDWSPPAASTFPDHALNISKGQHHVPRRPPL